MRRDRDGPASGQDLPGRGSGDYAFRSRKKIEADEGQGAAVETKYRCKACVRRVA